jgi:nucleotide-binding universal stress UspA family protein
MATGIIVSYDGTPNDDDALALGKMLGAAGGSLALAYVRHSREFDARREELAQHDAEQRLERGAAVLGDPDVARHVVIGAATGAALEELAHGESASLIVFASDYRIPPGHVEPGRSAQQLLDGGSSVAVAVAPAGLRAKLDAKIGTIAVPLAGPHNDAARQTAAALAEKLGANLVEVGSGPIDLIIVGSAPGTPTGKLAIGGDVRTELNNTRSSVIVVPAESPLSL